MNRGSDHAFPLDHPQNDRQLGMTIREYALVHIAGAYATRGFTPKAAAAGARVTVDALFDEKENSHDPPD